MIMFWNVFQSKAWLRGFCVYSLIQDFPKHTAQDTLTTIFCFNFVLFSQLLARAHTNIQDKHLLFLCSLHSIWTLWRVRLKITINEKSRDFLSTVVRNSIPEHQPGDSVSRAAASARSLSADPELKHGPHRRSVRPKSTSSGSERRMSGGGRLRDQSWIASLGMGRPHFLKRASTNLSFFPPRVLSK